MSQSTSWTAWNRPGGTGGGATGGSPNTGQNFNFSSWFQPGSNWGRTQSEGNRLGGAASGAMSGASAGAAFGPWGAAIGGIGGGILGALSGGPKELSPAEQWVNNWDVLNNEALQKFGPEAIGRQWGSMGQSSDMLQNLIAQGTPDLSQSQGDLNLARSNIQGLSNFKPERIDRQMGDWRKLMESGMGSIVNPSMLAGNQQYQEAAKAIGANPMLSAQQKALMQAQGQRGLAQTNAMTQAGAIQSGMSALDDLAKTGDSLVERAKESAASLGLSLSSLQQQLSLFPYEWQMKLISLLSQDANQYADFMKQFMPQQNQYNAAGQGGRTGTDWLGMINQGVNIYQGVRGGRGGGGGGGSSPGGGGYAGNYTPYSTDWSNVGRTRDF